jgi:hypothetical protein
MDPEDPFEVFHSRMTEALPAGRSEESSSTWPYAVPSVQNMGASSASYHSHPAGSVISSDTMGASTPFGSGSLTVSHVGSVGSPDEFGPSTYPTQHSQSRYSSLSHAMGAPYSGQLDSSHPPGLVRGSEDLQFRSPDEFGPSTYPTQHSLSTYSSLSRAMGAPYSGQLDSSHPPGLVRGSEDLQFRSPNEFGPSTYSTQHSLSMYSSLSRPPASDAGNFDAMGASYFTQLDSSGHPGLVQSSDNLDPIDRLSLARTEEVSSELFLCAPS